MWPLLCGLAKAKYYLMLNDVLTGEEAERIGLVSLCVDDGEVHDRALEIAGRLAAGPAEALSLTKHALNNWLRLAGPTFDASLAMEFFGFTGPECGRASPRSGRSARRSSSRRRSAAWTPRARVLVIASASAASAEKAAADAAGPLGSGGG